MFGALIRYSLGPSLLAVERDADPARPPALLHLPPALRPRGDGLGRMGSCRCRAATERPLPRSVPVLSRTSYVAGPAQQGHAPALPPSLSRNAANEE